LLLHPFWDRTFAQRILTSIQVVPIEFVFCIDTLSSSISHIYSICLIFQICFSLMLLDYFILFQTSRVLRIFKSVCTLFLVLFSLSLKLVARYGRRSYSTLHSSQHIDTFNFHLLHSPMNSPRCSTLYLCKLYYRTYLSYCG